MKKGYSSPKLTIIILDNRDVCSYSASVLEDGEYENDNQWWLIHENGGGWWND